MTFGELFNKAGTNTVFSVFLGENTSEYVEILDSDFGAGTKEADILYGLMRRNVIRYIPGKMPCKRRNGFPYPHMTVVLDNDSDYVEGCGGREDIKDNDKLR